MCDGQSDGSSETITELLMQLTNLEAEAIAEFTHLAAECDGPKLDRAANATVCTALQLSNSGEIA